MDRRRFLALAAMGLLAACTPSKTETTPPTTALATTTSGEPPRPTTPPTLEATSTTSSPAPWVSDGSATQPFIHGVASGDPDHQSVVLWTKLSGAGLGAEEQVSWEIGADPEFSEVLVRGESSVLASDGHALHELVTGLDANRWYFYRFSALGSMSAVGRTRTLPAEGEPVAEFNLIAASCQDYQRGGYAALRSIADSSAALVVFLGDFIYATNPADFGGRTHDSPAPVGLDDYRSRYALYLSDPALRAARASLPWVVIWDDNEVAGNYSGASERSEAAHRAWFEHIPTRTRQLDPESTQIYRSVSVGSLADIVLLDGRQYRSPQACGTGDLGASEDCDERYLDERTMLGDAQEQWLDDALSTSSARWQFVAQQTMVAPLELSLGSSALYNNDQWDGYPAARDRLLDSLSKASSPVVLSGDLHAATVATLPQNVAAEFVAPSISSSIAERTALGLELGAAFNSGIHQLDTARRGYLQIAITPENVSVIQMAVQDAWDALSVVEPVTQWHLDHGQAEPTLGQAPDAP